jgi:hypothetical protein
MLRVRCLPHAALLACGLLTLVSSSTRAEWRLDDHLPDVLSIRVDHRTRYEFLDDQFRIIQTKDTDVVVFRTRVHGRLRLPWGLTAGAELQDSRAEKNDDTLLNTTIVNAAELLQAYLELEGGGPGGGRLRARGGRITMDVGSRRFVARNRFRNTANGFTGLDVEWNAAERAGRPTLRGFWTLPVFREPIRSDRLRDNDVVFDTESVDVQFWGLFAARDLQWVGRAELFVFGLHERDASDRPTRDRQLVTPGFRLFRPPTRGRFDHQLEVAVQVGESRASIFSTRDLDHLAHFEHLTLGYTFDLPYAPSIALQFDYASGDENPTDGSNERFDTLYGARRFDFGPTGIYGPFARSNLITPGLRLSGRPLKNVSTFLATRAFWLASSKDAWTTSGVRDPTGDSGRYVGTQVELALRWQAIPGNLTLEGGYAHLFAGDFIDDAPNSNRQGDSNYVYTQATIEF